MTQQRRDGALPLPGVPPPVARESRNPNRSWSNGYVDAAVYTRATSVQHLSVEHGGILGSCEEPAHDEREHRQARVRSAINTRRPATTPWCATAAPFAMRSMLNRRPPPRHTVYSILGN
ncbi:hypothetical protein [Dactylosporangium salmoneum]|uniref:Uncharacterized protein n=1 Tax=Dactylosporangium salmoneum TaxID=53361 RepID=A0ABN3HP55_9ACTN